MKIYIAGSITGQNGEDVIAYFKNTEAKLNGLGYKVFSPILGKDLIRTEISIKAADYSNSPLITNHAIIERDRWMVSTADIIYSNLTMSGSRISIGSMMELAWAHQLGKHSIVAMQPDNIHWHAFVLEAADVIFSDHESAMKYLAQLSEIERRGSR